MVLNTTDFTTEARLEAIRELEKQGKKSAKVAEVEQELKSVPEEEESKDDPATKDAVITNDPDKPALYTKRTLYLFSVLFATIFGAVLLMQNLKETGRQKARMHVLVFGIIYTAATIYVMNSFNVSSILSVVLNAGGGFILTEYFWNTYLGPNFIHRKKSITKPLIISLLIVAPFILALIYNPQAI